MKHIGHYMWSRTRWARVLCLCSVFVMGGVYHFFFNFEQAFRNSPSEIPRLKSGDGQIDGDGILQHSVRMRHLLQTNLSTDPTTDQGIQSITDAGNVSNSQTNNGIYPRDIFTLQQKKDGAIVLHVILMIYMFVALAIVCDEFFVPALSVITDKLDLSDDVAGATFMAAGGSAPELFTSLIGVFFARSDVGVGTIVGSAVFNILFVIGMCATFSKGVLSLTWWPLFRDCFFYSVSLSLLLYSFSDTRIEWYESLCLLIVYILYVLFMKFNVPIERFVKSRLLRKKVSAIKEIIIPPILQQVTMNGRRVSLPHFRNNASMFRHGALQLMLHTLDPLSDSDIVEDKAMQLQVMAKAQQIAGSHPTGNGKNSSQQPNEQSASRPESARSNQKLTISYHNGYTNGDIIMDEPTQITTVSQACDSPLSVKTGNGIRLTPLPTNGHHPNITDINQLSNNATFLHQTNEPMDHAKGNGNGNGMCETTINVNGATNGGTNTDFNDGPIANGVDQQFEKSTEQLTMASDMNNVESPESTEQPDMADMEVEEPLDISWPKGWRKRVTYILLAPLVYVLYFTLPDVRRIESRKWYSVTFIGCILWIAGFSYLMVWMAKEVGDTIGIQERVMGLTILAAGTSIPDLITSVIVARKGLGDMAVSSSVGSNIFDITVGLPLPWILWSISSNGASVPVDSKGLFCSIFLLFGMLILVVILIAVNKWRMTKIMGGCMFLFYVAFLAISLLLLADIIPCIIGV